MRETTAAQCPIHPMETQPCPACLDALDNSMASYNTGYAAGYRAAQAAMPPREPTQTMLTAGWRCMGTTAAAWRAMYDAWAQEQTSGGTQQRPEQASASKPESRPGPLDHQSAAGTNCATECAVRAPESSARGPAADPIADLCMQIRAFLADAPKEMPHEGYRYGELLSFAADALERLARERDVLSDTLADTRLRAERAEAERDALRECVRAADYMRTREEHSGSSPGCVSCAAIAAYDAARAKVKP